MRRRSRLLRVAKWGGVVVCVITVSGYLAHGFVLGWLDQTRCHRISIQNGNLMFSWTDPADVMWGGQLGWFVQKRHTVWSSLRTWWPPVNYPGPGAVNPKSVTVRFWFLCSLLAIPTYWLWRLDRRPLPGHCPCGYDLTGNESGVCPECGVEVRA